MISKFFPRRFAALGLACIALLAACSDDKPGASTPPATKPGASSTAAPSAANAGDDRARERTAAFFAKEERSRAREALAPLVARTDARFDDLIRATAIEFADNHVDAAKAFLDRAAKLEPQAAAVSFLRGQMAREAGETEEARKQLRAAHAAAPDDMPTKLVLADVEDDLENTKEAEKLLREVVAVGFANGQSWYVAAVFRLSNLLTRNGREAEAEPFNQVRGKLEKSGVRAPGTLTMLLGLFGRVPPPTPAGSRVEKVEGALAFVPRDVVLPAVGGTRAPLACDLDGDLEPDVLAFGPQGVQAALKRKGAWVVKTITSEAVDYAIAYDADNDADLDVLTVSGAKLALYVQKDEAWTKSTLVFPELPAAPSDVIAVDYDHEGDLDLCLVGPFGARLWRRDGANEIEKGGKYVPDTEVTGLPATAFDWCISEDFDGDNDVDLLFGGARGWYLADSLRDGKFAEKHGVFDVAMPCATRPIVADFDGDARPDLFLPGSPATIVLQGKPARASIAADARPGSLVAADFDLDGALDIVWSDAKDGTLKGLLAIGLDSERALVTQAPVPVPGALACADLDGDGDIDLACATSAGLHVIANEGPHARGVRLSYRGLRDNRRAVGAVVEVRAGAMYRRMYWRGEPTIVGVGANTKLDVLRIAWPNGVVTTDLDVDLTPKAGVDVANTIFGNVTQQNGQVGSCPFLYTWNGTRFVFVSDVLGITPLGLRMEPGMFVPPDHDEYVLVKGEELAPKAGRYTLQFTEELREVTYLDHARLLVVDHPVGTEIYPNERFTFPPFPEAHIHTVKDALAPTRAVDGEGRDWTAEARAIDDNYIQAMHDQPPQFAGLAAPWFVELAFDKDAVAKAKKLRLLMTGWFFWSDASANMASSRNPETPFIPPILQVPDGKGDWRDAGPPVGFPAGKTKTMVIDVTDIVQRDDPRIRVFTSLRLYWDALRLAVDDDDAVTEVATITVNDARLWRRGFSAPLDQLRPGDANPANRPERFDWNVIAAEPRWNQHPGLYTRYGPCVPLLSAVDDQFVILGAGDALTIDFDATRAPALKDGMRRDFLVFLDGWAKDRDPNTISALEVEPLPFHAMSGYPYAATEHFPDDDAHNQWRAEWNTRAGYRWIQPVSPVREAEWLLGR